MATDRSTRRVRLDAPVGIPPDDLAIAFDAPGTWKAAPLPRPVAILREPAGEHAFRANVVVTVERVGPLVRAAGAAAVSLRATRRQAQAVGIVGERIVRTGGHEVAAREQIVVRTGEPPLLQCVATAVVELPRDTGRACVQFTVTMPVDRATAPRSLGKGEKVSRLEVPGGAFRQWSVGDAKGTRRIAVAAGGSGPVVVLCSGTAAQVAAVCDPVLGTVRASRGTLTADPVPAIATTVAGSLKLVAAGVHPLPTKDRTKRSSRASEASGAYAAASKRIAALDRSRPWDRDLVRLQAALLSGSRGYASVEIAAKSKDRSRDARARTVVRTADASIGTALDRLQRRGYAVKGLQH